jgi:hypothetical protein
MLPTGIGFISSSMGMKKQLFGISCRCRRCEGKGEWAEISIYRLASKVSVDCELGHSTKSGAGGGVKRND